MEYKNYFDLNQKLIISSGFILIILLSSMLALSFSVLVFQIIMGVITLCLCFKTDYKTAKLF